MEIQRPIEIKVDRSGAWVGVALLMAVWAATLWFTFETGYKNGFTIGVQHAIITTSGKQNDARTFQTTDI